MTEEIRYIANLQRQEEFDNEATELKDALKRIEQENKKLLFAIEKCLENAGIECDDEEQALRSLPMLGNAHYKVLVEKEKLEQENKELKEVKEQLKKWNDENLKRQDDMQLWIDLAEEQRKKYRSALEEIRNIILSYESKEWNCFNDMDIKLEQISKVINEVFGEN